MDDCNAVCAKCSFKYGNAVSDVLNIGFWPSSVRRTSNYLFSSRLLELYDVLHKFVPGTSISGFVHSLEEISARNGRVNYLLSLYGLHSSILIVPTLGFNYQSVIICKIL